MAPAERPAFDDERTHLPIVDERPQTYGDCLREGWGDHDDTGPCPWVSCAHHLVWGRAHPAQRTATPGSPAFVEAIERIALDEMQHTCALRVAEEPISLAAIAEIFDLTRERVRQIEAECLTRLSRPVHAEALGRRDDDGHEVSRPELRFDFIRDHNALDRAIFNACRASNDNAMPAHRAARSLAGEERAARIAELRARPALRTKHLRNVEHSDRHVTALLTDTTEAARPTDTIDTAGDQHDLALRSLRGPLSLEEIV